MFIRDMKFNRKKLANGLTILFEKRDVPVTTVMLAVRYGSGYEPEKEKGTAHFIEHLCFKGTEKRSAEEISREIEKVGGILNAFTGEEETAYHVKLPSQHLELAMDVIFDIFFNPIFPEAEVAKESNVICEEIRMYNDNPANHSLVKIKELLYEKPFGIFAAGLEDDIKKMNRSELLKKHNDIYIPENAILCVVGDNDFDDVVRMAEKFCIDRKGRAEKFPEIKIMNKEEKEIRKEMQQAHIVLGFHFPLERYSGEVFSAILGRGMSSKLFTEVREKRGLAYSVKSDLDFGENYAYMIIYAGTSKNKIREVKEICIEEFKKMEKISEKELEEAKKQVIGNYNVEKEDSSSAALNLILDEIQGNAEEYYKYEDKINSVSLDDIKKLAKRTKFASFILSP